MEFQRSFKERQFLLLVPLWCFLRLLCLYRASFCGISIASRLAILTVAIASGLASRLRSRLNRFYLIEIGVNQRGHRLLNDEQRASEAYNCHHNAKGQGHPEVNFVEYLHNMLVWVLLHLLDTQRSGWFNRQQCSKCYYSAVRMPIPLYKFCTTYIYRRRSQCIHKERALSSGTLLFFPFVSHGQSYSITCQSAIVRVSMSKLRPTRTMGRPLRAKRSGYCLRSICWRAASALCPTFSSMR